MKLRPKWTGLTSVIRPRDYSIITGTVGHRIHTRKINKITIISNSMKARYRFALKSLKVSSTSFSVRVKFRLHKKSKFKMRPFFLFLIIFKFSFVFFFTLKNCVFFSTENLVLFPLICSFKNFSFNSFSFRLVN